MNKKMKKRLSIVTGVIVVVVILVFALVAGGTAAKTVSVEEAASGTYDGQKIQVTGNVVANSYQITSQGITFRLYNPDGDITKEVAVSYAGAVSATFGNDVTAICTGTIDESGVLQAVEMVTKCPSKYESGTTALTVERLLSYGESVLDKTVQVKGIVAADTLSDVSAAVRFVLTDDGSTQYEVDIIYKGALPDGVAENNKVVVTGNLAEDGTFHATDVALEK